LLTYLTDYLQLSLRRLQPRSLNLVAYGTYVNVLTRLAMATSAARRA